MNRIKLIVPGFLLLGSPVFLTSAQEPAVQAEESADSIGATYDILDDLVVTAKKDAIKSDGATLTYDLEQDDSSKGQSVLDALKKVPMVSVDGQDNIYVNGNSGIKILVDGKENGLIQSNASMILKSMPAESLSKIEVITEPGAKYDAEGTAGIINLVTGRKQTRDGYAGSIGLSGGSRNYGANAFGSIKVKNFNADANVAYADNHGLWQENIGSETTHQYDDPESYLLKQTSRQRVGFRYVSAGLKMSWQPNDKNLFTWGGSYLGLWARVSDGLFETSVFNKNGVMNGRFSQNLDGTLTNGGATADASWRHNFDSDGQRLIVGYAFNFGQNAWNLKSENESGGSLSETFASASGTRVDNFNREHTVQVDYANPFHGYNHLLEAGVKGVFRRNSTDSKSLNGPDVSNLTVIKEATVIADQIQDVYAAYCSYTGHYGNWSVNGGLRYEHTVMGMDFHTGDYSNFRRHLNDLVPNAAISYSFAPTNTLRLSYQMRISRPTIDQLNPFRLTLVETEVRQGNIDLSSEHHNNVTLTYSNFGRIIGGNVSLEYSQTNNTIAEMIVRAGDIQYSTYGNYGKKRDVRLSGFLNFNITPKMSLNVNGYVTYVDIDAPKIGKHNSGWGGAYGANWMYEGPGAVKFTAYGGQTLHLVNLNGYFGGWYYYGLGISRDFLKDKKLNIAINASNFLTKYSGGYSYEFGDNWTQRNSWKGLNWNVGINLTWKFGHLQEKAKQSGLDLTNTDASSTSSKGGGGIGI